jgi:hypothetical protein
MAQNFLDLQITSNSLSTFSPTADQRYLLGADVFLRTHFPMKLLARRHSNLSLPIEENDLLAQLLSQQDTLNGNRLWVVYGIPGSGKSELMRWLETRISQEDAVRAKSMVRISRNELDVLSIAERFRNLLPTSFFGERTYDRWNTARKKPRALTKLILLFALENLLDSDEVINALFYRLLNVVQPHVERVLTASDEESPSRSVELMSMEAWDIIVSETSLPITIEYEQFRHQLTTAFCQHLLEGLSLPDTLRQVSQETKKNCGLRPLLLIDDLVQSLNLFASDILDYFITLEEGCWDVVIGLTPAAFETSQRGRLLLQHISYLDTIDDRVEKLWLSDEAGYDSYVLTEENCHEFAKLYLKEYEMSNGTESVSALYPFNREALVRIYRSLPAGKGKPRYFLRHLQTILEAVAQGEAVLSVVAKLAQTEYTALCADKYLATLCECYGPLLSDETTREVTLPVELLGAFDIESSSSITLPIEPLFKIHLRREAVVEVTNDEEKAAVRDWLLNRDVNRQLLRPLRQGAARLLRTTSFLTAIHSPNIARVHGILSWQKPYLDIHPPISLEDVDENDGIFLSKKIGSAAFDLHRYAHAVGPDAKGLETTLLNDPEILHFFFQANDYAEKVAILLEEQLGMELALLAVCLGVWATDLHVSQIDRTVPLHEYIIRELRVPPDRLSPYRNKRWEGYRKEWVQFFEDFFKLRENLYDIPRLHHLCDGKSLQDMKEGILSINSPQIGKEYRWGKRLLREVIAEWQEMMRRELAQDSQYEAAPQLREWIKHFGEVGHEGIPLTDLPVKVINELTQENTAFASRLRVYLAP